MANFPARPFFAWGVHAYTALGAVAAFAMAVAVFQGHYQAAFLLMVAATAIDEARRIFGRITSYTIYRVALTMTIMFLPFDLRTPMKAYGSSNTARPVTSPFFRCRTSILIVAIDASVSE